MRETKAILCAGQAGSGKTTVAKHLARLAIGNGAKGRTAIVSPTAELGGSMPDNIDEWADRLVETNEAAIKSGKVPPVGLLILDDIDAYIDKALSKRSPWWKIAICRRQLGIDLIMTAKRLQNVSPTILQACDLIYAFRLPPSDFTGRERVLTVLTDADIPQIPFEFVCVNPNTGAKFRGRTRADGQIEFLRR